MSGRRATGVKQGWGSVSGWRQQWPWRAGWELPEAATVEHQAGFLSKKYSNFFDYELDFLFLNLINFVQIN